MDSPEEMDEEVLCIECNLHPATATSDYTYCATHENLYDPDCPVVEEPDLMGD